MILNLQRKSNIFFSRYVYHGSQLGQPCDQISGRIDRLDEFFGSLNIFLSENYVGGLGGMNKGFKIVKIVFQSKHLFSAKRTLDIYISSIWFNLIDNLSKWRLHLKILLLQILGNTFVSKQYNLNQIMVSLILSLIFALFSRVS